MTTARGYIIESLDTGLRVLQLFLTHDTLTVTGAAEALDVGRSTAHRVLTTLEARGFAVRDASGRGYAPGPELVRLGRPAGFAPDVRARLGAVLDEALRLTGETVQTVALIGDQALVTDGRESDHPVRVVLERGRTYPAYATSGGKVLLSAMTDDQVRTLFPDEELAPVTPDTLPTRTALLAELATVRTAGLAVGLGESVPGMHSVAVPLSGTGRRDPLALVACAPAGRAAPPALLDRAAGLRLAGALLTPRPAP
ncbi:IclR family transcriptional regulator [uncultured Streptomyces sp.]|uniref:IclR family transcriptional regulator n=1 Tax=uncultured Streptomyces sp. TaxID=174707 RepID=UPI00263787D9|nr:IclR family transcriptional regulator [uncultured Streptomyces sp.]